MKPQIKHIIFFLFFALYLSACQLTKEQKNIKLHALAKCDESQYQDETDTINIYRKEIYKDSIHLQIKFWEACCQEFEGNYTIQNDTLIFTYFNITGNMCNCICCYDLELKINDIKMPFKEVRLEPKKTKALH